MDSKKPTSADEYNKLTENETKLIELPSKAIFEIRKITSRDYVFFGGTIPTMTAQERKLPSEERLKIIAQRTPESTDKKKQINIHNLMICRAVINPQISTGKEEGKVCIQDIPDNDFSMLILLINEYSWGGTDSLKSFRQESEDKK